MSRTKLLVAGLAIMFSGGSFYFAQTTPHPPDRHAQPSAGIIGRGLPTEYFDIAAAEAAFLQKQAEEAEAARVAEETRVAEEAEAERQRQADEAARTRAAQVQRPAAPNPTPAPTLVAPPSGDCYGVNQYAAYIYMHESGCNPANGGNPNCEGIGQACPRGKMGCSWTDVACQLEWFENYAMSRYGSWVNAYNFWLANHWW